MSEANFTNGPWRVTWGGGCRRIVTPEGESIMCSEKYYPWTPESGHDWNLIAAAPEMYAMLDEVEHILWHNLTTTNKSYIEAIKTLLAKARGEQ